jgi:predicted O-methyltransferase YrrM
MENQWSEVDAYFGDLLARREESLEAALEANRQAGLPSIDVSRLQGKFLELLVRITGARRVLEIGTLGGYSTLWMAQALPKGGSIVTLEYSPHHAEVARENLLRAGVLDRVDLRVGAALESLPKLEGGPDAPFDLIFIDADKQNNPAYLECSLKLSRVGTVILCDNVVRDGHVIEPGSGDPNIDGVRKFTEMVAANPRLSATVLQTVGSKGWDGFALAVVVG